MNSEKYIGLVTGGAERGFIAALCSCASGPGDRVPAGDPQSKVSGESQGLQALANVSGHELSETRSDPHGDAWYASNGEENADQCAWTFGGPYVLFNSSTYPEWKIQGNWSNQANDGTSPNGPGYTTFLGTGLDGTNYPGPNTK